MSAHLRACPGWLFYALLAALVMVKVCFGHTYYAGDILYSQPLWYNWSSQFPNYDLIDSIGLYYPHDWLYNQQLHQGRLLSWNPYNFCGHPVFADAKSSFLYPPKLLAHLFLSATWAHDLLLFLHLWGMGVFFDRWLQGLGLSAGPRRLAATVWMLNGFVQTWLQSEYTVTFGCWLPLLLDQLRRALEGPLRPRPLLWASLLLGLLGYCGHAQFLAHCYIVSGLWGLYLVGRRWRTHALPLALGLLGGILLAAPQLLPMLELVGRSERASFPFHFQGQVFRNLLLSLPCLSLCPNFFGSLKEGIALRHISPVASWVQLESCAYLGLAGLYCLVLGGMRGPFRHRGFFVGLGLTILLLPATPFYALGAALLPPLKKTMATRWLFMLIFFGCTLIGAGAQRLKSAPRHLLTPVLALWSLWLVVLAFLQWRAPWREWAAQVMPWVRFPYAETFEEPGQRIEAVASGLAHLYHPLNFSMFWPWLGLLILWAVRRRLPWMLGLLVLDLLVFSWRFNETSPRSQFFPTPSALAVVAAEPPARLFSLGVLRPNTGLPFGVWDVGGQDSIYPRATHQLLSQIEPQRKFADLFFPFRECPPQVLRELGVGWVLTYPGVQLQEPLFRKVHQQENGVQLYQFLGGRPLSEFEGASFRIEKMDPGYWRFACQGPGRLRVRENFDPGWRATISGVVSSLSGSGPFLELQVPAGEHQVELHYQPPRLRLGLGIAGLVVLLWLGLYFRSADRPTPGKGG
jgi:hypothetical protein